MALQTFPDYRGVLLTPYIYGVPPTASNRTIDAAGESFAAIGRVQLSTGPGTSKTLSSSGGKIHIRLGTVTFANGSTTLRVGVQDIDGVTGLEDGTYDVRGDFVGGVATITSGVVNTFAMDTGTKTIAHGDVIAVVFELTARAGADSLVGISYAGVTSIVPYLTNDTGSGPAKVAGAFQVSIDFDDGTTIGWFGQYPAGLFDSPTNFANNSTPDEYALVFQVPFRAAALGLWAALGNVAVTDDFEMILYSDPLGTPVAERTVTQPMVFGGAGSQFEQPFTSAFTLEPNTNYAVALRPTTTGTLTFNRLNFGSGNGHLRKATMLGENWSQYTRTNQTGAFGSQDTTLLPNFGVFLGQLSDDAGGGGGSRGFGMTGGMA